MEAHTSVAKENKSSWFDGVECHLIGHFLSTTRIIKLRKEAAELGLGIRFHQGWSWETGQRNPYNVILRILGALVPAGTSLARQVRGVGTDPVVIYGNLVDKPTQLNYLYQTASEHVRGRVYAMQFDRFMSVVKSRKLRIVFDTQHILEWFLNEHNMEGLFDSKTIRQIVSKLWQELYPFTGEIHLSDFNPRLGRTRGLNVFLGDGVFPLAEFCTDVRASGWNGTVVPEVAPHHLWGTDRLRILHERVVQFFRE